MASSFDGRSHLAVFDFGGIKHAARIGEPSDDQESSVCDEGCTN
jgi:hypothetical protein